MLLHRLWLRWRNKHTPERIDYVAVRMGWPDLWEVRYMRPPNRHCNVLWTMPFDWGVRYGWPQRQGFVTNRGRYVDRITAAKIAVACGQIDKPRWGKELFSEDVW